MTLLRNFSFGGIDFSDWFFISKVTMPFLSKENTFLEIGNTSGSRLLNSRIPKNEIKLEGTVLKQRSGLSVQDTKDEMIRALNSDVTKKLIFNQLPDRYFNAIFDGLSEYDATDDDISELEITFVVPDGVAYAIDFDIFTNAVPEKENLFLDSEFESYHKYFKDWTARDGTYSGSNVLSGDFRDLVTIYKAKENWFPETSLVTRPVSVKKGDSVSFAVMMNLKQLATDNDIHGRVILEERDKVGGSILYRHIVNPAQIPNSWQQLTKTILITNEKTKALCLTFGVYGNAYVSICKPQFNLGATLNPYTKSKLTVSDTVELTNAGTDIVYPEIEVSMQGENGLIGVVNSNGGILQYGNEEDVDIKHSVRKDTVINFGMRGSQPELTLNDTTLPAAYPYIYGDESRPNLVQGNVAWDKPEEVYPVFKGVGEINVWHGPRLSAQIPKSSNNTLDGDFLSAQRVGFTQNGQTARGRMEFVIADENKKLFMSVIIRDSTTLSSELSIEFYYKDKLVQSKSLDRRIFNGNFFEVHMDKMKRNTELRWRFSQIKSLNPANDGAFTSHDYEFIMKFPERELTKAAYVSTWFMRYSNQHHILMSWTDSKFIWTNEAVYTNIENLFSDKDKLVINTKSRKIMLNDVENRELHKLGNQYEKFRLGYGNHVLQVVRSDWALPPIVTVKVQKTYL